MVDRGLNVPTRGTSAQPPAAFPFTLPQSAHRSRALPAPEHFFGNIARPPAVLLHTRRTP